MHARMHTQCHTEQKTHTKSRSKHLLCIRVCFQALKLLHDSGIFYGHLHASNIIVDEGVCRLVDVENGMLGVPSALRPAFTQLRKINVRKH